MVQHYIRIAWRNLTKKKLYSFVNITGLTVGITGCILIGLFVWNELNYDTFHQHADRIVRVTMEYKAAGTVNQTAVTGTKVGPQLKRTFPEVEAYARTIKMSMPVANGTEVFDEKNILFADKDFFSMFSFGLVRGNTSTALDGANKIVLTEAAARKYFGTADPVGKTVKLGNQQEYEITGIAKAPPLNSQVQFDFVASFSSLGASKSEIWFTANYITYLMLNPATTIPGFEHKVKAYMQEVTRNELQADGDDYLSYNLEPLKDVHLHSTLDGLEPNGNITYIYVLIIVAILILLIACVNYTNLTTVQSAGRSTEIGIRKVMGAGKASLFRQFMGESALITAIALVFSVIAAILLLPLLNSITGKTFTPALLLQPLPLLALLGLGILVSFIAGFYPAFILTNTGLVTILKKGMRTASSGGGSLRKSLIVFQFAVSVFLIISTIVVMQQISYIQHKDIGYDKEQVLVLPVDNLMKPGYQALKDALSVTPGVVSVSGAYEDPTFVQWGDGINVENEAGMALKSISVTAMPVDLQFLQTMGMDIVAGEDFSKADFTLQDTTNDYANYRNSFMLNEAAAAQLGWTPQQAVGKTVSKGAPGKVKAVIRDFHFQSLHNPIGPLVLFLDTSLVRQLFIKIAPGNIPATIAGIEQTWESRVAHRPFSYHFLDEDFDALYLKEQRTASLFALFSGLAIALACLGLFAMAAFTTLQRTKEIGIRKVLGAGTGQLAVLVSKEFTVLVLIAILIAAPAGWYATHSWLQQFAYRVDPGVWVFVLAGILAIITAIATVSFHAIKAALANPVSSLRSE